MIRISDLRLGESLRLLPEDLAHARLLAEVGEKSPPIFVHAETLEVIEGHHRVLAARLRGKTTIRARLFHGSREEAFLVAVRSNATHGKPLSLPERLLAASRILRTHPTLSDAEIADVCGLSPGTVASRRKKGEILNQHLNVSTDGSKRQLSSQLARQQAAEMMLAFPNESNRRIARETGLSETTVRDIRHRMATSNPEQNRT
jgi:ParB-like chromosome segregation protein Spo0J